MLHSSPDRRLPSVTASQRGTSGNNASEVQTFISYAGITDVNQISALDYLVDQLKSTGLWSKMHFIYPFIGGNATSHKYELIDPSISTRELTFVGVTHGSFGITGTASVNASATSGINAGSHSTNNLSFGYYGTLKGSTTSAVNESGVMFINNRLFISFMSTSANTLLYYGPSLTTLTSFSIPDGFKALSSTSTTTGDFFFNQIKNSSISKGTTALSNFYGHELSRTTNTAVNTVSFSYASTQLTEAELTTLNSIVEVYQTMLGRNSYYINPNYDVFANRFIFNCGSTNFTENERNAINYLITNLRLGSNLWDKLSFIYPFVGASSLTTSLKEMKSLGTVSMTISGSASQSSLGVEITNTSSFAAYGTNFGLNISSSRTILFHVQEDTQSVGFELNGTVFNRNTLNVRNSSNQLSIGMLGGSSTMANTDARGLYIIPVPFTTSTNFSVYKNGSVLGTATTGTLTASNGITYVWFSTPSLRISGFYGGSNSYLFTVSEIAEANSIINTYLQMLGRT